MGYNIDSVNEVVLDAWMSARDVHRLHDGDHDLPEVNFLEDMVEDADAAIGEGSPDKRIRLPNFNWYGEFSGHSYDLLVETIAPSVMGNVEAIFTWEGGDSFTGLLVKDGKVAKCEVDLRVIRPEGWPE